MPTKSAVHLTHARHLKFLEILGLALGATDEELNRAKKRKLMEVHPDRHPEDANDEQKAQLNEQTRAVNDACDALLAYYKTEMGAVERDSAIAETFQDSQRRSALDSITGGAIEEALSLWIEAIVEAYERKCEVAEARHAGDPVEPNEMRRIGAYQAAAIKRARHHFFTRLLEQLIQNRAGQTETSDYHQALVVLDLEAPEQYDMTIVLAQKVAKAVIGRRFSMAYLVPMYATKGRTAADKTQTTLEDMSGVVVAGQKAYSLLCNMAWEVQAEYRQKFEAFADALS